MPLNPDTYDAFHVREGYDEVNDAVFQQAPNTRAFWIPGDGRDWTQSVEGNYIVTEGYLAVRPRYFYEEEYTGPPYSDFDPNDISLDTWFFTYNANPAYYVEEETALSAGTSNVRRPRFRPWPYTSLDGDVEAVAYRETAYRWGDKDLGFAQIDAPENIHWFNPFNFVNTAMESINDTVEFKESFIEYSWKPLTNGQPPTHPWNLIATYDDDEYILGENLTFDSIDSVEQGAIRATSGTNPTYAQLTSTLSSTEYFAVPYLGAGRVALPNGTPWAPLELRLIPAERVVLGVVDMPRVIVIATWWLHVQIKRPIRTFELSPVWYTINADFRVGSGQTSAPETLHEAKRQRDRRR